MSELTDGRVGYLHVPDMGAQGIQEFVKWFYGQVRKEGLVIDVRGNGGGNVSQMLIERLGRRVLGTSFARTYDTPGTYPAVAFHGHLVCILDEDSASDGDIFPYRFREAGLGPLIGKRSWGGVIGITSHGPLLDGGSVNVPQFGHQRRRRKLGRRERRRRAGHRGRERPALGHRRPRPAARTRGGGGAAHDAGGPEGAAGAPGAAGQDAVARALLTTTGDGDAMGLTRVELENFTAFRSL